MIRFIEDLGIIPNKDKPFENDPSLKQGQKMMEYGRVYNFFNLEKMKEIETNTYPSKKYNVKTFVETMDTIESATQNKSKVFLENTLSKHEAEFYRLLTEYSNISKILAKDMLKDNKESQTISLTDKPTSLIDKHKRFEYVFAFDMHQS